MVLHIILGINIDTPSWIEYLKSKRIANNIVVLDYLYDGKPEEREGVMYMSGSDAEIYSKYFSTLHFYTSLYAYPLKNDGMFSLYK